DPVQLACDRGSDPAGVVPRAGRVHDPQLLDRVGSDDEGESGGALLEEYHAGRGRGAGRGGASSGGAVGPNLLFLSAESSAPQQQAENAGAGADGGERRRGPEGEHAPGEPRLELSEALAQLRVEAREIDLVQFTQVGSVSRVHVVKPGHELIGDVVAEPLVEFL